jgi:hypothetical protein
MVAKAANYNESSGRPIGTTSPLTFQQFRSHTRALTDVFAFESIGRINVTVNGNADTATGQLVSGAYYRGLGVQPVLGRTITEDDDQPAAAPVAVLNYSYWQRRFGLDPSVIGKTVTINRLPFTVIGVTPKEFSGTEVFESPDIFMPLALQPRSVTEPLKRGNGGCGSWERNPGVTNDQVHADLREVFRETAQESWDSDRRSHNRCGKTMPPLAMPQLRVMDEAVATETILPRPAFRALASNRRICAADRVRQCNLFIARGAARQSEIAVRSALGAGRTRLIRQLLVESVMLASCGGMLGTLRLLGKGLLGWVPGSEATCSSPISTSAFSLLQPHDFTYRHHFRLGAGVDRPASM